MVLSSPASDDERWSFRLDANTAEMMREVSAGAGALVCGRRLSDLTNGWNDSHPMGRVDEVTVSLVPVPRLR